MKPPNFGGVFDSCSNLPQIWLYFPLVSGSGGQISLRPPIFNSRICTDTLVAATVLTKLRSNRYFSAHELRIDFTEHELHELHEYVA